MKIQISESGYNDLYEGATYGTFSTFKLMDNRENLEDALSFCSLRKVMPVSYTPLLFRQNSPK
jgi:muconolactone delta-isomerase